MPMIRLRRVAAALLAAGSLTAGALVVDSPDPTLTPAAVTAGTGPVSVAVVVPLTVPPTTTGLLDAETLAAYTQQGGILDRELDALTGTGAVVALDPMITASIRVLGASAPADALTFLTRLEALPNEVFLLAYADADPALAVLAGTQAELTPIGFESVLDPANFGPAATPSATPTPGPSGSPAPGATTPPVDPGAPPPLPSTADVLAWPSTLPSIAWPAEGTVTSTGLAGLSALGYDDVLISDGNVPPAPTALVGLGDIDGLVVDEAVSTELRDAVFAATDTEFAAAEVRLTAALESAVITAPGRTLIATVDRRWPFGSLRLAETLASIEVDDSAQLVSLTAVLGGPRATSTLVEPDPAEDVSRVDGIAQLAAAARAETAFLSIADEPAVVTEPRRLGLLGLSAIGWRSDDAGWDAALDDQLTAARATLDAVRIVDGSDQFVVSQVSSLKLQVSNALPVAVTVLLSVRPLQPLLHVEQPSVTVTIEPDSTSGASVPVQSISNGEVTVRAELHAADGAAIGSARFFQVVLQAGWETLGTVIAGALVVLIFGGGLVRSILRRRRDASAAAGSGDGDD